MVHGLVRQWWYDLKNYSYAALGVAALFVLLIIGGLWMSFRWYVSYREEKAQFAMSEAFEEYDKALFHLVDGKSSQEVIRQRMEDAHLGFDVMMRNHGGSYLLPYAAAFEADVFWYEGKKQEALFSMEKAVRTASGSPLLYLLKTKLALMRIDMPEDPLLLSKNPNAAHYSTDEALGLKDLLDLATDANNPHADTAAFYLGYYYWSKGNELKARESWQLLEKFDDPKSVRNAVSPWLAVARTKLEFIS